MKLGGTHVGLDPRGFDTQGGPRRHLNRSNRDPADSRGHVRTPGEEPRADDATMYGLRHGRNKLRGDVSSPPAQLAIDHEAMLIGKGRGTHELVPRR